MDSPKTFLLKKICGYKENGFESLGQLHTKHIDDLSEVLKEYAEGAALEVIESLNKGEAVDVNGKVFQIKKQKRKQ